ncbi:hypothetical protein AQJ66_29725 [Streptomyces bungoensis]|uniref:Uncharacterized protein n=1 Tax=Streptomyces bungoensis TaxID=285568 RepID=A0A101SS63_9ACTN|nr:hypothetical protein [Streptomyces bungoensis]KUN79052.1 hypothetical protein AQJ66_29725 [Streptomyces bungoensis]
MTSADLAEMRDALVTLRRSIESLRTADGESPYVRRLMNDLDRFQLDMEDIRGTRFRVPAAHGAVGAREVIAVHDRPYHHQPWQDADDEGIGGHRR